MKRKKQKRLRKRLRKLVERQKELVKRLPLCCGAQMQPGYPPYCLYCGATG